MLCSDLNLSSALSVSREKRWLQQTAADGFPADERDSSELDLSSEVSKEFLPCLGERLEDPELSAKEEAVPLMSCGFNPCSLPLQETLEDYESKSRS